MDFTLSLQQKAYLFQEPVFVTFKLSAVQKTVKIPLNYEESKGLIVSLFDSSQKPTSLNVSILAINPVLAVHEAPDQCIIILLLIFDGQKQLIKLVKIPWNQDASAESTVQIVSPPIEPAVLSAGEKITAGRTIKVSDEMIFSILITSKGNILFSNGGAYGKCASINPSLSAAATLIRSNQGDVSLLFPEKNKGLATQRLFTMPRMD